MCGLVLLHAALWTCHARHHANDGDRAKDANGVSLMSKGAYCEGLVDVEWIVRVVNEGAYRVICRSLMVDG